MKTHLGEHYNADSQWLRAARLTHGLYQHQLAALLDIHPGRISEWETGRKPIAQDRLQQLKEILN